MARESGKCSSQSSSPVVCVSVRTWGADRVWHSCYFAYGGEEGGSVSCNASRFCSHLSVPLVYVAILYCHL